MKKVFSIFLVFIICIGTLVGSTNKGCIDAQLVTLNYDEKPNFSDKRSYDDIDKIVDEILELQDLLKQEALKLMKEIDDN